MSTRCSTARGPARSPSLVTWPTRRRGAPVDLAMRVRRSTQVRTWARLPAGWPSSGSETDWSESTTTRAGRWRSTAASMASTSGPSMARRLRGHQPDARGASPDLGQRFLGRGQHARRARWPPATTGPGRAGWTCRCPGGPKSRVTEPATTPPPMTRSSSPTPVGSGCMASVETSASANAGGPCGRLDWALPERAGAGPSVFHSPQAGSVRPSAARSPRTWRR